MSLLRLMIVGATFCLFCSCLHDRNGIIVEGRSDTINMKYTDRYYPIAEYIDSLHVVNLEVTDSSIISSAYGIGKVIYRNGRLYVFDNKFMAIKVFDTTGKYLFSLGSLGRGWGQFMNISDVQYCPLHNSIRVLCLSPNAVEEFSLDGKFLTEKRLRFFASSYGFERPNTYYYYTNQNKNDESHGKNVMVSDTNGDIRSRLFDLPKNIPFSIGSSGGVYPSEDSIYFNPAFSNEVYSLSGGNAKLSYYIDFGKSNVPTDVQLSNLLHHLDKFAFLRSSFFTYRDWVGFNYEQKGSVNTAFYNIISNHIISSDIMQDSVNHLFYNMMFQSNCKIIMVLNTTDAGIFLRRHAEIIKRRFPQIYEKFLEKKMHDNPTLLLFTLKNS